MTYKNACSEDGTFVEQPFYELKAQANAISHLIISRKDTKMCKSLPVKLQYVARYALALTTGRYSTVGLGVTSVHSSLRSSCVNTHCLRSSAFS
ncbi:hypothetical protein J6590_047782 [Homalodisca vitripennis]|nr:hypothetical protein J6590_100248 [Homalodisca vitripennis]KAG8311209.1 hypothetical protein J6590_047782 [Homalodisca vitripennis]